MLVLALDTSSPSVSVALVELLPGEADDSSELRWGRQADWSRVDGRRHGELLATGVRAVLEELGGLADRPVGGRRRRRPRPVHRAAGRHHHRAWSMADALGIPAYGACSLDAVDAWGDQPGQPPGRHRRAAQGGLLGRVRRRRRARRRPVGPDARRPSPTALRETAWEGRVVGDGAVRYAEHFPTAQAPLYPSADALVLLTARRVVDRAPSEPLTPLYLRRPDAVAATSTQARST